MDTKEFQKMLDGQTQEIERHMGALKEHFQDQLKGVVEGITMTRESLERSLDGHDQKFESIDQRFNSVDQKLDSHTEMIGNLMEDVEIIKEGMKKKVDYEEFALLKSKFEKAVA